MKPICYSIILLIFFSCTKTEQEIILTPPVTKPKALFNTSTYFRGALRMSDVTYIDSFFTFTNKSDTASTISYQWDFGDGNTSVDVNPKHQYHQRGLYTVKLIVNKNNESYDTAFKTVKVILGQQTISFGTDKNIYPNDVIETADKGFLIAGTYNDSRTYTDNHSFFLKTDSLLHQTDLIVFPPAIQFSSAKKTNDGNYILCGTTTGSDHYNELIKVNAKGDILWHKTFDADLNLTDAEQCADNSFAFVGYIPTTLPRYFAVNVIGKTDPSGNKLWTKTLDQNIIMYSASNVVTDDNTIVVAGVKRFIYNPQSYFCQYCDSLVIAKYSADGQLIWNNAIVWGLNTDNYFDTRIAKHLNTYSVINKQINGLYLFDNNGNFQNRKLLQPARLTYNISTSDNNILTLGTEFSNGFSLKISKNSISGIPLWLANVDGSQYFDNSNNSLCCVNSEGSVAIPLSIGGNLIIGTRFDYASPTLSGQNQNILLLELDEDGTVK